MIALICCLLALSSATFGHPQYSSYSTDQNVVPQSNYGVQSRIAPAPRVLVSPQQQLLQQKIQKSLIVTEADRLESIKNSHTELNLLSKTKPSDFIFDFDKAVMGVSRGTGGRTVTASSANFPGLINHGIAMSIGYLGPCGFNLPHTHPRATEILFSVDGDFIVGFHQENGAEFIMNDLHKNQAAVFPKGAIHFEQNLNCVPATFVAAFNNEDPGVLTIGNSFFGSLPATIVGASLGGLDITTVEDIRLQLVQNPSIGIAECRKRCGL